ncbi:FCD domain-containing protein [Mesorhizobium sp. CAU 1741]|uniref:FadR/GntR family transcriptional regulator n=1 Tax=Mesorhizobium sp. CAU 1741 TaxID=3140366 RepID=UPI00325BD2DD
MTTDDSPLVVAPQRRRKRSDALAARIRDLISLHQLAPGDRLPQAWLAEQEMKASKGTMREAMKALETQGLIKSRTGPGGGAFVTALSGEQAMDLLSNLFLFNQPSIADVFTLRKLLEPTLVGSLAGRLERHHVDALQAAIGLYDSEPTTAEDVFQRRIAELDFHSLLASFAQNQLLGFVCVFLHRLLRDLAKGRADAAAPEPQMHERMLNFQVRLVRLLMAGDSEAATTLTYDHLQDVERYMLAHADMRRSG